MTIKGILGGLEVSVEVSVDLVALNPTVLFSLPGAAVLVGLGGGELEVGGRGVV